ncbi:hypothetical protein HDU88_004017 [Geranomyces variabilis]|nr:hypothetical protein HDU88_004017 [Geranomyces variabilis]
MVESRSSNGRDPARDTAAVAAGFSENPSLMLDWWLSVEANLPRDDPLRRDEAVCGENAALPGINTMALGQLIAEGRTDHVHRFWTSSEKDSQHVAKNVQCESVASWVVANLPLVRSPQPIVARADAPCILLGFYYAHGLDREADQLRARYPISEQLAVNMACEQRRWDILDTIHDGEMLLQAYNFSSSSASREKLMAADTAIFSARFLDLLLARGVAALRILEYAVQKGHWRLVQELIKKIPAVRSGYQPQGHFNTVWELEPYLHFDIYADGRTLAELIKSAYNNQCTSFGPWYWPKKFRAFAEKHGVHIDCADPCGCAVPDIAEAIAEGRNIDFKAGHTRYLDYEDYGDYFDATSLIRLIPYSVQLWVDEMKRLSYRNHWQGFGMFDLRDAIS